MGDTEGYVKAGKELGLEGEELMEFIKGLADEAREQRLLERDKVKLAQETLAVEIEKTKAHERIELEKARVQLEVEREKARANEKIEVEKLKLEREKLERDKEASTGIVKIKVPPFNDEKDDLDTYLSRFESVAEMKKWKKEDMAIHLSTLLTGEALKTFFALSDAQRKDYTVAKDALLRRYALTEDEFRKRFFVTGVTEGETVQQFMARLEQLFTKWIDASKIEQTYLNLKNLIIREGFLQRCEENLKAYLKEKSHTELDNMVMSAQKYIDAHGGKWSNTSGGEPEDRMRDNDQYRLRENNQCRMRENNQYRMRENGKYRMRENDLYRIRENNKYRPRENNQYRMRENDKYRMRENDLYRIRENNKYRPRENDQYRMRENDQFKMQQEETDQRRPLSENTPCSVCKRTSHKEEECWFKDTERAERKCFQCGSTEHIMKDCGEPKGTIASASVMNQPLLESRKEEYKELSPDTLGEALRVPLSEGNVNGHTVMVMRDTGFAGVAVNSKYVNKQDYTDEYENVYLLDSTQRKFQKAIVEMDTKYFAGICTVLVVDDLVMDCVIGNIKELKDDSSKWYNSDDQREIGDTSARIQIGMKTLRESTTTRVAKNPMRRRNMMGSLVVPKTEVDT